MAEHKGQTDKTHQITLPSSIERVQWATLRAAPGGMAGLEIRTRFVGHGAPVKIQLLDKQGRSHGAFDDQIVGNRLDAEVAVPQKADGALIADVKLPKHGLSDTSPALWLTAPVTVKNAEWSTDEARRGDVLTLTADAKGAPAGTEAEVVIFEHDDDNAHDLITRFPVLVEGEKVEAEWEFEYHEDTDDIPRQEELDRRTDETGDDHGDYKHPEYFFRVDVLGQSAESDLVRFNDWIELALVDRQEQPVPNERYFLELPDGEEKKGTLDEQGKAMCEVPPGPSKALFPDVGEAARPSASSTPSTSESRPADDAPESTPPPDDEPAPAPPEETSESFSVTAGELERIWPEANPADIERFTGPLNETLRRYGIDTPLRAAHFLAQVGHESKMLQGLEEDFYYRPGRVSEVFPNGRNGYSAEELETKARQGERALANALYGGDSRNLGNTQEGDGWRFRGRGLIHLTGRGNYEEYGAHQDMNLTSNPEKVAEPYLAADVAGWYFENRVPYDLMDQDDVVGVSAAVNLPIAIDNRSYVDQINGLDDRKAILRRAKRALSA